MAYSGRYRYFAESEAHRWRGRCFQALLPLDGALRKAEQLLTVDLDVQPLEGSS